MLVIGMGHHDLPNGNSLIFTVLLASGIRLVSAAKIKSNEGGSATATVSLRYLSLSIAALIVLFGIYLIVPQFH